MVMLRGVMGGQTTVNGGEREAPMLVLERGSLQTEGRRGREKELMAESLLGCYFRDISLFRLVVFVTKFLRKTRLPPLFFSKFSCSPFSVRDCLSSSLLHAENHVFIGKYMHAFRVCAVLEFCWLPSAFCRGLRGVLWRVLQRDVG